MQLERSHPVFFMRCGVSDLSDTSDLSDKSDLSDTSDKSDASYHCYKISAAALEIRQGLRRE